MVGVNFHLKQTKNESISLIPFDYLKVFVK
jgi:hypothetical protein